MEDQNPSRVSSALKAAALAVAIGTVVTGCGTVTATVPDAEGVEHISGMAMGCNEPYVLTQDCSGFSGAKRLIEVNGFQYKIAGSEDGSIVFMMGAKPNSDAWAGKSTETGNVAYEITKKYLFDNGIKVTKVEPVSTGSLLVGYVITTDGNAYQVLSGNTIED